MMNRFQRLSSGCLKPGLLWFRFVLRALLPCLFLAGCKSPPAVPLMPTPLLFTEFETGPLDHIPSDQHWNLRRVYYATTRAREPDLQRIDYGNDESAETSVGLALVRFGERGVSWDELKAVSRTAERPEPLLLTLSGIIEAGSFLPGELRQSGKTEGPAAWLLADLNASIAAARDKDLMIYVHGAKVNFYNACAYAAQLDHFMGRDMTSIAFSWPSRQNILAYGLGEDVDRLYRSTPSLVSLIEMLAEQSSARRIHLVAWSAGGRLVTAALKELGERAGDVDAPTLRDRYRLGTVYLAAADVPGDEFVDALPGIAPLAHRIVVTASSHDGALEKAKLLMGGESRIGTVVTEVSPERAAVLKAIPNLEVVDVSRGSMQRGFDITGHRYWFDHPWSSSDLILAVRSDLPPALRGLEAGGFPVLWIIPDDYPQRLRENMLRPGLEIRTGD